MKKDLILTPVVAVVVAITCSAFGGKQTTCPNPNPTVTQTVTVSSPVPGPTQTVTVPGPVQTVIVSSPVPGPTETITVSVPSPSPYPVPGPTQTVTVSVPSPYPVPGPTVTVTVPSPSPSPYPVPGPTQTVVVPSPVPSPYPVPGPTVTVTPSCPVCPAPSPSASPSPSPSPKPSPSPSPSASPSPTPTSTASAISAVWANDGEDKVPQEDLRTSLGPVTNTIWDGTSVNVFGAQNEVVAFNLVLEAKGKAASAVSVSLSSLTGPGGTISGTPATGNGVFNYTNRDIEMFYIRYLKILGVSRFAYENYDERHAPKKFQRPWTADGQGTGLWTNRPDHDKSYPDIAVPIDLVPTFSIALNQSQAIWTDIYIPKGMAAGVYTGTVQIKESGTVTRSVPVSLTVRNFALPDVPNAKTMLYVGRGNIETRYAGTQFAGPGSAGFIETMAVEDKHFQMAHRHKISLIDDEYGTSVGNDQPVQEWVPRLNGSLFTNAKGYRGPGENVGNGVYSVGTYGSWDWPVQGSPTQASMQTNSNAWMTWFQANVPPTQPFLYLIDESSNYAQTEQWAKWLTSNPGVGKALPGMATVGERAAYTSAPDLGAPTLFIALGNTAAWQSTHDAWKASGKPFWFYNGKRPGEGSFATEVPGTDMRMMPWAQWKKGIDRWFYWESAYYNDNQNGQGDTNVFAQAKTIGPAPTKDSVLGMTSSVYTNGDGVLFYPGKDLKFPTYSYGVDGPIASLRLKHWRRGIQDFDYLNLANAINPVKVAALVNQLVPTVLWEVGAADSTETWQRCDIGWDQNPDDWESARKALADIIEGK